MSKLYSIYTMNIRNIMSKKGNKMQFLHCEKCGGKLKLENNGCVCLECGKVYDFLDEEENENKDSSVVEKQTDNLDNTPEIIEEEILKEVFEQNTESPKKKQIG